MLRIFRIMGLSMVILCLFELSWAAEMAQWWERSPPTNKARVWLLDLASHVGWVCCWFSPMLQGFFSGYSGFPPSTKSTLLNSNSIWKQWMKSHLVEMPLQICYYYYYYYYRLHHLSQYNADHHFQGCCVYLECLSLNITTHSITLHFLS